LSKQQLAARHRDPSHVKHVTCHLSIDGMSHLEKPWHGDSSKKAGQSFTLCKTLTFDEKDFLLFSNMQSYLQCYEIRVHRKYVSLAYF